MSNLLTYIAYFRRLAAAHKDIKHDVASETSDSAVEKKHFCKWNAEEVIQGLRTKVSFLPAALLLELYDTNLKAEMAYDIKQRPRGAFTVLRKAEQHNTVDEEYAFNFTEKIVYDILRQVWQDHHADGKALCNTPFRRFWFDRLEIIPVGPLFDNTYGWRVEFEFEFHPEWNITQAPADGVFYPYDNSLDGYVLGTDEFLLGLP